MSFGQVQVSKPPRPWESVLHREAAPFRKVQGWNELGPFLVVLELLAGKRGLKSKPSAALEWC